MKKYLLIILFFTGLTYSYSQQYNIKGCVLDQKNRYPLNGAIILISSPDSGKKAGCISSKTGRFEVSRLSPSIYKIKVSYVGFKSLESNVQIEKKNIDLGNIILQQDSIILNEVTAIGELPVAEQNGDTVQYMSKSYKVHPGANADDLVEKMPGITIEGKTVTAQGEKVNKVLVNGKRFVSEDPISALKNLPADFVEQVKIFDEQNEQAAFMGYYDGQTTKTMNIVTKQEVRNSSFGKVMGGYGNEKTYYALGSVNLFDDDRRISFIGQSNNINNSDFMLEEMLSASSGKRNRKTGFGGLTRMLNIPRGTESKLDRIGFSDFSGVQDGISTVYTSVLSYSESLNDKLSISADYFFNQKNNDAETEVRRSYLETSNLDQDYYQNSASDVINNSHKINAEIQYYIDSTSRLTISPALSFRSNISNSFFSAKTIQKNILYSSTNKRSANKLKNYYFDGSISYLKKLNSSGRGISINISSVMNENIGDGLEKFRNEFYDNFITLDSLERLVEEKRHGYSFSTGIAYLEPLTSNNMLQAFYSISSNKDKAFKKKYDKEITESELDSLLSNAYNNEYRTQCTGINLNHTTKLLRLSAGLSYNISRVENMRELPKNNQNNYVFKNILPSLNIRFKKFVIDYSSDPDIPSLDQLQNVIDYTNQLQLFAGNPDLNESITHRFRISYLSIGLDRKNILNLGLSARFTHDYIGNNTIIATGDTSIFNNILLHRGMQLTHPINLDNFISLNFSGNYGTSLLILKSNINLRLYANYSRRPNSINNQLYFSCNRSAGFDISLSSRLSPDFNYIFTSGISLNDIYRSDNYKNKTDYLNSSSGFSINCNFTNNLFFQWNSSFRYSGLSGYYTPRNFMSGAGLGFRFQGNSRAELKLSVNDLFNSGNSIRKNSTELYIEDITSDKLSRFFMLNFTYNFRPVVPEK